MLTTTRSNRRIAYRSTGPDIVPDSRFPRAVAGEEFERYARATWRQAERWFRRNKARVTDPTLTFEHARDILWSVASVDLGRRLYPQEERLLSEMLDFEWLDIMRAAAAFDPEIPEFLRHRRASA
jgi:hypothetical protein